MSTLSTYREGSLHAELKARYAAARPHSLVEAAVDGFVIDVAGSNELVEIQTASFASSRRKLGALLTSHSIVLVHPIPVEKWLVTVDDRGTVVRRRRSPRSGQPLDAFEELVHISDLLGHPRFRLELVLTREEEIRGPIPAGARYRYPRTWWRLDRRLVDVLDTLCIDAPTDLLRLLPTGLPEPFTTGDIVSASRRSKRLAMRAAYTLERAGAVARLERRGRYFTYGRVTTSPPATS